MKFLGVVTIIVGVLISQNSFADFMECKGNVYSRWDDGLIGLERMQIVVQPRIGSEMVVSTVNGKFTLETKRHDDDWIYYSYLDKGDELYISAGRPAAQFYAFDQWRTMRPDRESFFRFRDKALVGFNIVCRM